MNNKGVITRGMAILTLLIVIALVVVVIFINTSKSSSENKYKEFESELVDAAKNYYIIKNLDIDDGEEKKITMRELTSSNLVYNDLKDKCSGYVTITSEKNISTEEYEIVYNAYIKCSNKYITSNYSEY